MFNDNVAGFNMWSSHVISISDAMANRNSNAGFGGYYGSSVHQLGPFLARDNLYAGLDFENATQSFGVQYGRIECGTGSSGIILAANSNMNVLGYLTVTSGTANCANGVVSLSDSEFITYVILGALSDIEIKNSGYAIQAKRQGKCTLCDGYTFSGITTSTFGVFDTGAAYNRNNAQIRTGSPTLYEEFIGGTSTTGNIGQNGWAFTNGSIATIDGVAGIPGRIAYQSAASNVQSIFCLASCGTNQISPQDQLVMSWSFFPYEGSAMSANATVGLQTNATNPADQITFQYCEYNDGQDCATTGETQWYAVTERTGASKTRTATGISVTTAMTTFTVAIGPSPQVIFYINGSIVATNTANVPTNVLQPILRLATSGTPSTPLQAWIDAFWITWPWLSR